MAVPSLLPSRGRDTPRWSVAGQPLLSPASMAGLAPVHDASGTLAAVQRAWVWGGPPLLARGASRGSVWPLRVTWVSVRLPISIPAPQKALLSSTVPLGGGAWSIMAPPPPAPSVVFLLMVTSVGSPAWFG